MLAIINFENLFYYPCMHLYLYSSSRDYQLWFIIYHELIIYTLLALGKVFKNELFIKN